MTRIAVLGAGAFGTALALVLSRAGREVTLWARDPAPIRDARESPRLPGHPLPEALTVTGDLASIDAPVVLLAMPMQALGGFLAEHASTLDGRTLVACCKGIDLATGQGAAELIAAACPAAVPALISGPGFAADLAADLPTAMTLGCRGGEAVALQSLLSAGSLRLYLTSDLVGVGHGGAIKNVIAIACGIAIGAGLGTSAHAALLTRGYAEMTRFAVARGADPHTLSGLSGLGDLVLTAGSEKSRNFRHGIALGRGETPPQGITTEGVSTAIALARAAAGARVEMPITDILVRILSGDIAIPEALRILLARPLRPE